MTAPTPAADEIDAIIANLAGWRGVTLARLREIVLSADSAIVEEVKMGDAEERSLTIRTACSTRG